MALLGVFSLIGFGAYYAYIHSSKLSKRHTKRYSEYNSKAFEEDKEGYY